MYRRRDGALALDEIREEDDNRTVFHGRVCDLFRLFVISIIKSTSLRRNERLLC